MTCSKRSSSRSSASKARAGTAHALLRSTGSGSTVRSRRSTATRDGPGGDRDALCDQGFCLLQHIVTDCPMKACANAEPHDPYFQQLHRGRVFPARRFPPRALGPEPLAHKQLATKLELLLSGEPAAGGGARQRRAADRDPGAGHGGHHGAAQEHHLPDRCQAAARRSRGYNRLATEAPGPTAANPTSVSPNAPQMMARRIAHAKQFNRHRRQLRVLRPHPAKTADPRHPP